VRARFLAGGMGVRLVGGTSHLARVVPQPALPQRERPLSRFGGRRRPPGRGASAERRRWCSSIRASRAGPSGWGAAIRPSVASTVASASKPAHSRGALSCGDEGDEGTRCTALDASRAWPRLQELPVHGGHRPTPPAFGPAPRGRRQRSVLGHVGGVDDLLHGHGVEAPLGLPSIRDHRPGARPPGETWAAARRVTPMRKAPPGRGGAFTVVRP
jgi:hypothetical protein